MPLRLVPVMSCGLILTLAVAAAGNSEVERAPSDVRSSSDSSAEEQLPQIREFDVATLSRLGREIYRHDQIAWHGTDAVFEKVGQAKMAAENCRGWVIDISGEAPLLRFVRKTGEGEEAAYDVRFPKDAKPQVTVPENRELTVRQKASRRALATATTTFAERELPLCRCRGNYNFVVLDDPSGLGHLVYLLRPKDSMESIPIGGHYRISVSADGETVIQVDRLWASCLTMDKRQESSGDGALVAIGMNHIVSSTPLETHVFLSLQDAIPFGVITKDGQLWMVENGEIRRVNVGKDPPDTAEAGT